VSADRSDRPTGVSGRVTSRVSVSITGDPSGNHWFRSDAAPDLSGPDRVYVDLDPPGHLTVSLDRPALEALIARLTGICEEWDSRAGGAR